MNKRFFDVLVSAALLILLSPLISIVAISVRFFLGNPIIFFQERPGLNERIFRVAKFRTMINNTDIELPDSDRLSAFGRFLRRTSMDELPELANVLKGDMSLVGPRPLLVEYLALYSKEQRRRHEVRPGITGWAQVNGRNAVSWEKRFSYDIWYVDHCSMLLDIKILMLTVVQVFRINEVNQPGSATMEKFKGNFSG